MRSPEAMEAISAKLRAVTETSALGGMATALDGLHSPDPVPANSGLPPGRSPGVVPNPAINIAGPLSGVPPGRVLAGA